MNAAAIELENAVDKLLDVLDADIRYIRRSLSTLDDLRRSVIRQDDAALRNLLKGAQSESNSYRNNEARRQQLREELAIALGCTPGRMTLSRLETELSEENKAQVSERKIKLQALIGKLRTEHVSTMMLLSDCARFNSTLLKSVFQLGATGEITYSRRGSALRQTSTAFMDLQF